VNLGSLVGVVTYFNVLDRAGHTPAGVRAAIPVALVVHAIYMALARWSGYLKQFDFGLLALFATGALAATVGGERVLDLFAGYSSALVFAALALTAFVPLALGREPFTLFYARLQTPLWQQRLADFDAVVRASAVWWGLLFVLGTVLCVWSPADPLFTFVYPNLLVLVAGISSNWWLPPLYFRVHPPSPPDRAEPLILGMPAVFDRRTAGDARATIQFVVTGDEPGSYIVRIAKGRCRSAEGRAADADLTITTPGDVWLQISRGELDGAQALAHGRFHAEGELSILAQLPDWFRAVQAR